MNTPYQWTKQVASHWGGTRNGTIVALAQGDQGQGRDPLTSSTTSSTSRRPSWRPPACPRLTVGERHRAGADRGRQHAVHASRRQRARAHIVQYFEMMGNRGIYHDGWTAVTKHRTPWKADTPPSVRRRRVGALRSGRLDAGTRHRRQNPRNLLELQRLWLIEAVKYNVRAARRPRSSSASTPTSPAGRQLISGKTQLLFDRMRRQ